MADPVPYDPDYAFSGFQAVNPARPLPAPQLDNELAAIAEATAELANAVKDIRRSDGALQNNIVTADSLSPDAIKALGPNGTLIAEAVEQAEAAAAASIASANDASASTEAAAAQADVASTQAGIATTQAGNAAASAAASASSATASDAARVLAETARDAAFGNANVYDNTAAGVAAVSEGGQFMVVATSDEIIRYQDVSGVAVAKASYPTAEAVAQLRVPLAIALGDARLFVSPTVSNGATYNASTRTVTVPSGSSGNNTALITRWLMNNGAVIPAEQTGRKLRIRLALELSVTFTRTWTSAFQVRVGPTIGGTTTTRTVTPKITVSGTRRIYEWDYTLQGDESEIRPYAQLTAAGATASDETIYFAAYSAFVLASENPDQTAMDFALSQRDTDLLIEAQPSLGNLIGNEAFRFAATQTAGAVFSGLTLTIPAGQTGDNALLLPVFSVDGAAWVGRRVEYTAEYETSVGFDRLPDVNVFRVFLDNGTNEFRTSSALISTETDGTLWRARFAYTMQGDEITIQPYSQLNGAGGAAGADQTITLRQFVVKFLTSPDAVLAPIDLSLLERERQFMAAPRVLRYATPLAASVYDEIITVSPGGGADFTDPVAAYNAITRISRGDCVLIDLAEGLYETGDEILVDGLNDVRFIGRGPHVSRILYNPGDGASSATIDTDSAFKLMGSCTLEGLSVHALNARYTLHPESNGDEGGGNYANRIWRIINCEIAHLGNPSPNNTRAPVSQNAIGSGTSSGKYFLIEDSVIRAVNGSAFAVHNNADFAERTLVEIRRNTLIAGSATDARAISLGFLQSGRADRVIYEDNTIVGDVVFNETAIPGSPDFDSDPSLYSEIQISGSGNSPHLAYAIAGSAGHYHPRLTDEESMPLNDTGATIAKRSVLAWDGSRHKVRLMTSADAASLFAGVALSDIADGDHGRVKVKGWLRMADILRSDNDAEDVGFDPDEMLTFGSTMSVVATSGAVELGGSQGLFAILRTAKASANGVEVG